jgi:hypothetical protein
VLRRTSEDEEIIRYVLGQASEEEIDRVEDRVLADAEYAQYIEAVEEDLIDDYLRGGLPAREREHFEIVFLSSPLNRERLEFASALRAAGVASPQQTATESPASSPVEAQRSVWQSLRGLPIWLKLTAATPAMALLIATIWLAAATSRLHKQAESLRSERMMAEQRERELQEQMLAQRQQSDSLANELARVQQERDSLEQALNRLQQVQAQPLSFILLPVGMRAPGEAALRLTLPRTARTLRLRLEFDADANYPSYRVKLRRPGGDETLLQDRLRSVPARAGKAVVLIKSSKDFPVGDYTLSLYGVTAAGSEETVEDYPIIVKR